MSDSVKKLRRRPTGRLSGLLNCLTLAILLLTCLGALVFVVLFQAPGLLLNYIPTGSTYLPLPVPATAVVLILPSPLPISTDESGQPVYPTFPPTWTPEDTPTVTQTPGPATASAIPSGTAAVVTDTPVPSQTLPPTATEPPPTATSTGPTPTATATQSAFRFTLQPGNPTYLSNFLNNQGCNWFGIVGRAFGSDGEPIINLTVHLEGGGLNVEALTGSGSAALGPGGYQIPIADHPIATTDTYRIDLRNNTGQPWSDVYVVPTFGECTKNMVMVNFVQNH
jgi:hypothetical protein